MRWDVISKASVVGKSRAEAKSVVDFIFAWFVQFQVQSKVEMGLGPKEGKQSCIQSLARTQQISECRNDSPANSRTAIS